MAVIRFEAFDSDINLKQFQRIEEPPLVKQELNQDVWNGKELDPEIRERLLAITEDFWDSLEFEGINYHDIILVGSLANYNWHALSDFDLHIVVDYNDIDDNFDLVKEYLTLIRKRWNDMHDIYIKGFEVEISFQDLTEEMRSAGVYSVLKSEWIKEPNIVDVDSTLVEKARKKYILLARQIDRLISMYDSTEMEPADVYTRLKIIWKKIKGLRQSKDFLEIGEYAPSNLTFKMLRNNGYLEKITKLKTQIYDRILSWDTK